MHRSEYVRSLRPMGRSLCLIASILFLHMLGPGGLELRAEEALTDYVFPLTQGVDEEEFSPEECDQEDCYTLLGGISAAVHQNFQSCGQTQTNINERIGDCALKNGQSARWDGAENGHPSKGLWKLVTVLPPENGSGVCGSYPYTGVPGSQCYYREVWRDERTNLLWSSKVSTGENWCRADGDITAWNPVCSNPLYQPQIASQIAQSYCKESGASLMVPVPAAPSNWNKAERWADAIYSSAKGGMGLKSAPSVAWALPSLTDYEDAIKNGLTFVLPDMGDFGRSDSFSWTSSVFSAKEGGSCYLSDWGYMAGCTRHNNQPTAYAVRCKATVNTDSIPPVVAIKAPLTGATLAGKVTAVIAATDNVHVTLVELYANGKLVDSTRSSPYQVIWDTSSLPNGVHILVAKAHDAAGNSSASSPVSVTVQNIVPPPLQVMVTADKSSYQRGATLYYATLTVKTSNGGIPTPNVPIVGTLTWPSGQTETRSATTNASGTFTFSQAIQASSPLGTYKFSVTATKDGTTATQATTFVVTEPPKVVLQVEVKTDQAVYERKATLYHALITAKTSVNGVAAGSVPVVATLTWPSGQTETRSATTDASGAITFSQAIQASSPLGTYKFSVTATQDGTTATQATTFVVTEPPTVVLQVDVKADQALYVRKAASYNAVMTVTTSANGVAVGSVPLVATFTFPDGSKSVENSSSNSSGKRTFKLKISRRTLVGSYKFSVTASYNGTSTTSSISFAVR